MVAHEDRHHVEMKVYKLMAFHAGQINLEKFQKNFLSYPILCFVVNYI